MANSFQNCTLDQTARLLIYEHEICQHQKYYTRDHTPIWNLSVAPQDSSENGRRQYWDMKWVVEVLGSCWGAPSRGNKA